MTTNLRFGLLGASRIADTVVIQPSRHMEGALVTAVGASTPEKAAAFAEKFRLDASGDYDWLISHPDVDVVYNALMPSAHAPWTLKALAAGKHVFLEKPAVTTPDEAIAIVDAANAAGLRLVEAFHYRYHPLFARALEIVRGGELGTITTIAARFDATIARTPGEFRWSAALGGGALADLGCYCVHWLRTLAGAEPEAIEARQWREADGVDRRTEATLTFPGGVTGLLETDMEPEEPGHAASLTVTGSLGELRIRNPIAPHWGHTFEVTTSSGTRSEVFPRKRTNAYQMEALVAAITQGTPLPTEGQDIIGNATVIDAIRKAAG